MAVYKLPAVTKRGWNDPNEPVIKTHNGRMPLISVAPTLRATTVNSPLTYARMKTGFTNSYSDHPLIFTDM